MSISIGYLDTISIQSLLSMTMSISISGYHNKLNNIDFCKLAAVAEWIKCAFFKYKQHCHCQCQCQLFTKCSNNGTGRLSMSMSMSISILRYHNELKYLDFFKLAAIAEDGHFFVFF